MFVIFVWVVLFFVLFVCFGLIFGGNLLVVVKPRLQKTYFEKRAQCDFSRVLWEEREKLTGETNLIWVKDTIN